MTPLKTNYLHAFRERVAQANLPEPLHGEMLDHLCCSWEDCVEAGQDPAAATRAILGEWPVSRLRTLKRKLFFTTQFKPMLIRISAAVILLAGLAFLWPKPVSVQPVAAAEEPTFVQPVKSWPTTDAGPPTASPLAGVALSAAHSGFGMRVHPITKKKQLHRGIDFKAKPGTPVLATAPGRVVVAGDAGDYGIQVQIVHDDGYVTSYNHLQEVNVKPFEQVTLGQQVGTVGNTGLSKGPHLHYEVRKDDKPIDPLALLD